MKPEKPQPENKPHDLEDSDSGKSDREAEKRSQAWDGLFWFLFWIATLLLGALAIYWGILFLITGESPLRE